MPTTVPDVTFLSDYHQYRAQHDPDGSCWVFGDRSWTWGQAWEDIQRFAGALRAEGVGRGDRFAFIDKAGPGILMAMHAASLTGSADVVPSWRLAGDEFVHVLNDSGATVLFLGHELVDVIEPVRSRLGTVETIVVVGGVDDELDAWIAAGEPVERTSGVQPDDPCLVMYSSGTTGRPKGALLTQRNMIAHTRNAVGDIAPGDDHQLLITMPMLHTYGLFGVANGIPGVIVGDVTVRSLVDAVRSGLTHAFLRPVDLAALARTEPEALRVLGLLKAVSYGAMPTPLPVLRGALEAWPNTRFSQVYGMMEFGGAVTLLDDEAHRDPRHPERLASVGKPLPGAEVRIVDPDTLEDVDPGTPGELWFRTDQATPGYLHHDPVAGGLRTDDGWLRTGDVGRIDAGFVFVEDRVKDMIITSHNCENVFSCEVERVLSEHPSVLELAVIGIPEDTLGEAVKAVIVFHPEKAAEPEELMSFARERLAAHKVPSSFDVVESLPRGSSGKVLKRRLRDPYWVGRDRQI